MVNTENKLHVLKHQETRKTHRNFIEIMRN